MDDICNDAGELLRQAGITDDTVQRFVAQYNAHLRAMYKGQRPYIAAADGRNRDREVYLDWKAGLRPNQIASKRGIDLSTVYRCINRWRKRGKPRSEGGFGNDEWNL